MPREGFERATPVFEQAKTGHALDHAAILIGGVAYSELHCTHATAHFS
jgi:hypothetical protein